MNINRNNYEIWFLDFYEGKLNPSQIEELMNFLDVHYDLKEEFENFENVSLPPIKKVVFDGKEQLKKNILVKVGNINESNYTDYFIAYHEGDLSEIEKNNVLLFLEKNISLKNEFELFSKTKVAPDEKIKFDLKQCLKKETILSSANINENNYTEYFIAAFEGDLTLQQHSELKEFLNKNPHLSKEYNLFGQTKITFDTAIVFNRKEQLKKTVLLQKTVKVRYMYYAISVAASLLLIISIYALLDRNNVQQIYTAERRNIELKSKNVQKITDKSVDNTASDNYADNTQKQNISNISDNKKSIEQTENIYASSLNNVFIGNDEKIEISKITIYEDFYAMVQRKKENEAAKEENKNDDNTISLTQFALYKIKKSIAPQNKKDKIKPSDKLTGWDLADAGLNKFNELTGAEATLVKNENNNGYKFSFGDSFELAHNIGQ